MKKLLALALALLMVLPALTGGAETVGEPFSFRGGVTWDSSPQEVMELEGTPGARPLVEEGVMTMYLGRNYSVGGYPTQLSYLFLLDKLGLISCGLLGYEDGDEALEQVKEELSQAYGEPSVSDPEDLELVIRAAEAVGAAVSGDAFADAVWYIWRLADGRTLIYAANMKDAGGVGVIYLDQSILDLAAGSSVEGSLWEKVCREDERCLAADAEGKRFLILGSNYPEYDLWVLDAETGERSEVYFSSLENAEKLAESCIWNALGRRPTEEQKASFLERYGSAEAVVQHMGWNGVKPVGIGGDYFLLEAGALGYVRIDGRTGEASQLPLASKAAMAPDGSVAFFYSAERKVFFQGAQEDTPTEYPLDLPWGVFVNAMCLLSDGSVWLMENEMREEKLEVNGYEMLVYDAAFVCFGPDGQELRRVEAGCFNYSCLPQTLFYSEEAGVGIAGGPLYTTPIWVFGESDDTARALAPVSLTPPTLKMAEREEVSDEVGYLLQDARMLPLLGLSADQQSLLLMDADTGYLLRVDLDTLEANVMLTYSQITEALEEMPIDRPGPMSLTNMFWNGSDLLSNMAGGCVLRLPAGD